MLKEVSGGAPHIREALASRLGYCDVPTTLGRFSTYSLPELTRLKVWVPVNEDLAFNQVKLSCKDGSTSSENGLKLRQEIEENFAEVSPTLTGRERSKPCLFEHREINNGFKKALVVGLKQLVGGQELSQQTNKDYNPGS